jgi:hypothetical protein
MCRENIKISVVDYGELIKLAKLWHPQLALLIEETKVEYQGEKDESRIVLNKDLIPEEAALEFFESLMDSELSAYDENDLKYFCRLVEAWRPIAEGR